jgi:hypothetical protein
MASAGRREASKATDDHRAVAAMRRRYPPPRRVAQCGRLRYLKGCVEPGYAHSFTSDNRDDREGLSYVTKYLPRCSYACEDCLDVIGLSA